MASVTPAEPALFAAAFNEACEAENKATAVEIGVVLEVVINSLFPITPQAICAVWIPRRFQS